MNTAPRRPGIFNRTAIKRIIQLFFIVFGTVITQVGGAVYLAHLLWCRWRSIRRPFLRMLSFTVLYLSVIVFVLPRLAALNGRVPMPVHGHESRFVRPHTWFTVLANRHYVRPELRAMTVAVAEELQQDHPGVVVEYLDANFPLLKRFRMYPHLRHDNGKKLDLAYVRRHPDGSYAYRYFSFFGYGFCAEPLPGEPDMPRECADRGRHQYNILERWVPDQHRRGLVFDTEANADLLRMVADHAAVRFVITEPHLQERTGLQDVDNIGSLGCWAIRHDDHLHVQAY